MKLHAKVALITGAGRGIGKGCALELARQGADIVVNDRPGGADLAETVKEIHSLGRACTAVEGDVFTRQGCERLFEEALSAAGRVDILISNPAFNRRADFLEYDPALFEGVIAGTLTSGFHMAQLAARHMVQRGNGGKIIFISSIHASMPYARSVAYNAAKAGLSHMSVSIAVELAKHRINVNAIEPGWIDTPGERATFGDQQLARQAATLPWGRLGTPADIGKAATFLASDDADYITGAILRVDGGFWWKDCRSEGLMAKPK
jgi:glucose 1-dehydrogenase